MSDSNGTSFLRFAGDNKLALVNTLFSVSKGCTSRTFNVTRPADRKRIDYIITRQPHRKLVRNITVHLQPRTDSDHSIVCATVRLRDRLARNRKQRAPTGCKSMERRAITSDTNWREGLIQRIASQLTQTEPEGTVGKKAAIFTDPPVLSTCPLHTKSGCGKERRTLIGPWRPAKAALVRNYLEVYWPCAGGLSVVNAIGTQLRDPKNSGLTRWRMAVHKWTPPRNSGGTP